jgi:hypothetical protein
LYGHRSCGGEVGDARRIQRVLQERQLKYPVEQWEMILKRLKLNIFGCYPMSGFPDMG